MKNDGFLHKHFLNNGDKLLHKWIHYFDIYERHFEKYRDNRPVVLEIGVSGGGSLEMWKSYFGNDSRIIGIDINPKCKIHEKEGSEIFIGSQDDKNLLNEIINKYPKIDIVIDDGSHLSRHIKATFNFLYDKISPSGVYLIEDLHTNYWHDWEGGYKKLDTFIEYIKEKIDELNAVHTRGAVEPTLFTATTNSINIYDSIIVIEKKLQATRKPFATHGMLMPSEWW